MFYIKMKIFPFLLSLAMLLIPSISSAQLRVGPTVGSSVNYLKFAETDDSPFYSSKVTSGYHGGLAVNYRVNDRYSLHTEWLYLYRQKDVAFNRNNIMAKDQASLHYLAIPILYRVSFHSEIKKSHQEWYLNAGPALHYWMGGKGKLYTNEYAPFLQEGRMDYDVKFGAPAGYGNAEYIEPANRWQMAIYAGGGLIFDLGFGKHIWFDARTSLGAARSFFSNDAKGDYGLQLYKDNLQSSVVSYSLSIGYFQDINILSTLKKGKVVTKKKKAKKLQKNSRPATSGK